LQPPALDACFAALPYAYPWSGVIADYKFRQRIGWARHLAQLLRSAPWVEAVLEQADWVLPMPLSVQRLQQRGYNQAWELARHAMPRSARGALDADLLLRIVDTPPQPGLPRAQRLRNLHGAFAVNPLRADQVQGCKVVLIDDVMTSGASLNSAATVLRQAGAAHITGVVLARTDSPDNGARDTA
jgi:ComF family protein